MLILIYSAVVNAEIMLHFEWFSPKVFWIEIFKELKAFAPWVEPLFHEKYCDFWM